MRKITMDGRIIIIAVILLLILVMGKWGWGIEKLADTKDEGLDREIENIYNQFNQTTKQLAVKITKMTATPGNAYTTVTANVWSGSAYTAQENCNLLIIGILEIYGYGADADRTYTGIYDGDNVILSTLSSVSHSVVSNSVQCTVMGYKSGLTKGQTITIKLRGSASVGNRARLDGVEMYIIELAR